MLHMPALHGHRPTWLLGVALFAALMTLPGSPAMPRPLAQDSGSTVAWVELGPGGAAIARVITHQQTCPPISLSGGSQSMQVRAPADQDYPVLVCEATLPAGNASASVAGISLALPSPQPQRILILGDTGCRLKLEQRGEAVQACNNPDAWPDAEIAASAAAWQPDLILHVGDYLYREAPCPPKNNGCAGSPWGYNWDSWNADFFTPEAALLPAAPWVFVRGDHEVCERAGDGWFRFLDPRPMPQSCQEYTDPYAIPAGDLTLLMLDSANADDFQPVPSEVSAYTPQFASLNGLAGPNSWLLTHRPVWVFGVAGMVGGAEQLFRDNPVLQAASQNQLPPGVNLVISGHIHLFESLSFDEPRPPQLVIGNGGTALDPNVRTPLDGMQIAGATVKQASVVDKFGYMTAEPSGTSWAATLRDVSGQALLACSIESGSVSCSSG
jgi:hypothetical protein